MRARSLLVLFSLSPFSPCIYYIWIVLCPRVISAFICTRPPYIPRALPFMIRLLIPGPTRPRSRLSKVLLIRSFAFVLYAVRPPSRSSPRARPLVYKLYILHCSSLVHISNKILPLSPLRLSLKANGPTRARDARPRPRPSPLYRSVIARAIAITPSDHQCDSCCHDPNHSRAYSPRTTCSPINLAPPPASVSDRENRS